MTDQKLWEQLKAGDQAALQQIYQDHAAALIQYGRKFSIDESLIEDCVQELFVDLWQKRQGLSNTTAIRPYLFVALRRRVIKHVEKLRKTISSEEPEESQFQAEFAIDEQIIAKELSAEQAAQLKMAMEQLSRRQQEALYLKYFANMDYKDIGEAMNISYQSVRNLVFNALQALRKHFGWTFLWWVGNFF